MGTPRDKEILDADWALGSFDTNLRVTRYGEVTDTGTTAKTDDTITPKVIVDLSVDYAVTTALHSRSAPTTCSTSTRMSSAC